MASIEESILNDDLNILIVSSNQTFLNTLQQSIYSTSKSQLEDRPYHYKVHICPNLAVVDLPKKPTLFDFVVFGIDPKYVNCLNEVEENLRYLGKSFGRERICLVAIKAGHCDAIKPEELWNFARIYQFNMLIGGVETPEKAEHLSRRILNLSEVGCGCINGIPLVGKV